MNQDIGFELCKSCGAESKDNFCAKCGSPTTLKRINGRYILAEIRSILNLEKGILYTIKELFIRPDVSIQRFMHNDRNRLVKPLLFIIICSLIYTVAQQLLRFEDGYVNTGGLEKSTVRTIFEWIQKNYGFANILMAIFITTWIKLFFKKYKYNFFEIIVLLCFVMGNEMIIYTTFGILESIIKIKVLQIGAVVGILYTSWAIGRFFDKKKKINYLKGLLTYILGMITFYFIAIMIGVGVDLISKL